ncbi:hypothetical protein [Streptosporangium sp. NPDC087985]|uniref:hypothetical protein n=1 Tax=Streptosporangium sp. NPDC087985 TaxID=3366196 RepID=UPI00381131AD
MTRLIPYPTLAGEVSLEIREAHLDSVPLSLTLISTGERVIALHQVERENWEHARLSLRMRVPLQELTSGPWSEVSCVAVLNEKKTNTRVVTPLRHEVDGVWGGNIELHHDDHLNTAMLTGHVVATVDGIPGRVIGSTIPSWTVDLQSRVPTTQKSIKQRWVDFSDEDNPHLNAYKSDPWAVDAVGDEPVVYLNSSFEGLGLLLGKTSGVDPQLRDLMRAQLAVEMWITLFNAAAYAVRLESGQPEWPGGWYDSVLRRMLPDIYPDRSPDDGLFELMEIRRRGDGGGDLQMRVLHAASKQSKFPRSLGSMFRTIHRTTAAAGEEGNR